MSNLEAQVAAIFEKMVNATISEMSKVTGVLNSAQPSCTTENHLVPSAKTVSFSSQSGCCLLSRHLLVSIVVARNFPACCGAASLIIELEGLASVLASCVY